MFASPPPPGKGRLSIPLTEVNKLLSPLKELSGIAKVDIHLEDGLDQASKGVVWWWSPLLQGPDHLARLQWALPNEGSRLAWCDIREALHKTVS